MATCSPPHTQMMAAMMCRRTNQAACTTISRLPAPRHVCQCCGLLMSSCSSPQKHLKLQLQETTSGTRGTSAHLDLLQGLLRLLGKLQRHGQLEVQLSLLPLLGLQAGSRVQGLAPRARLSDDLVGWSSADSIISARMLSAQQDVVLVTALGAPVPAAEVQDNQWPALGTVCGVPKAPKQAPVTSVWQQCFSSLEVFL